MISFSCLSCGFSLRCLTEWSHFFGASGCATWPTPWGTRASHWLASECVVAPCAPSFAWPSLWTSIGSVQTEYRCKGGADWLHFRSISKWSSWHWTARLISDHQYPLWRWSDSQSLLHGTRRWLNRPPSISRRVVDLCSAGARGPLSRTCFGSQHTSCVTDSLTSSTGNRTQAVSS